MYRGLNSAFDSLVPGSAVDQGPIDSTVTSTPFDTGANALIAQGYGDSSTMVDTSTGLPLYVASPLNPNPVQTGAAGAVKPTATTTISPLLIAGGAGLLLLLVVMAGGRRR